jgi:PAS domain S-box-containing protein
MSVMTILGGLGVAVAIEQHLTASALGRLHPRLANAAYEGLVVVQSGHINDANAAFCELVGAELPELVGRPLLGAILTFDEANASRDGVRREGKIQPLAGGREIPVEVYSRLMDDGARIETSGLTVLAIRDLRERRAAEEKIRYLAEHDGLTGLANRTAMGLRLDAALEQARASGERLALVCIDLDRFKEANDLHGHHVGDALLVEAARRLRRCVAAPSFVARLGGDEFVVVQKGLDQPAAAAALAGEILEAFTAPMAFGGSEIISGRQPRRQPLSRRRRHGRDPDGQRRHGPRPRQGAGPRQLLLLQARHGPGDPRAPRPGARPQARAGGRRAGGLLPAAGAGRRRRGLRLRGPGALATPAAGPDAAAGLHRRRRGKRPDRRPGRPCAAARLRRSRRLVDAAPHRRQPLAVAAAGSGPAGPGPRGAADQRPVAARLELEITESALFQDYQRALDNLRRLKALGVRIAMDDFGTGYSSLSTLQSFPFDKIKIDKSFVEQIHRDGRATAIVRAVLGLGRSLGIPVVAEGVETDAQLAFLRTEGCDELQGFAIGRPTPLDAIGAWTPCSSSAVGLSSCWSRPCASRCVPGWRRKSVSDPLKRCRWTPS